MPQWLKCKLGFHEWVWKAEKLFSVGRECGSFEHYVCKHCGKVKK